MGDGYAGVSIVGNRLYAMGGLTQTMGRFSGRPHSAVSSKWVSISMAIPPARRSEDQPRRQGKTGTGVLCIT